MVVHAVEGVGPVVRDDGAALFSMCVCVCVRIYTVNCTLIAQFYPVLLTVSSYSYLLPPIGDQ